MEHILWQCEGRRLHTALKAPVNHAEWPSHFRLNGLLLTTDDIDPFDILQAQQYMTTTLIERRADERAAIDKQQAEVDLDAQLDNDPARDIPTSAFGGRAASSTDCLPQPGSHFALRPTGRAASSADGFDDATVRHSQHETYCIAISDDEAQGAASVRGDTGAPVTKRRRTSWKNVQVPTHITRCQDLLEEKRECARCGARATVQYRVKFVQAHADCAGIADKVAKGTMAAASRVHVRSKRVHAHLELASNDSRQLSPEWLLEHGKLPLNVTQLEDFGPLSCLLCGSVAASSARKTFVPKHVKCLQSITMHDHATGTVRIDLDTLRGEAQRSAAGLPPLCAKKRKTLC
eukprot:3561265-Amphidinium_carterae.1